MSNCKTGLTNISSVERDPVFLSQKAKPGGVATLDANGKVPLSQIDIKAMFTERDPVYTADRGQPFGCATLDGRALVINEQLGSGTPNAITFLRGDRTWSPLGAGVPDATKFLRGDGVWATPTGGGGGVDEGWVLTGTDISLETATNKVVVGALPTIAKFAIKGDVAADVTAIVRAASGQSADILEIQDSTGTILYSFGATVYFEMKDGSTAPVSLSNHGRQRYNDTAGNKGFEVSVDGGPWERVITDEREVERISAMMDL